MILLYDINAVDVTTIPEINKNSCDGCFFKQFSDVKSCFYNDKLNELLDEIESNTKEHCGGDPVIYKHKIY